MQSFGNLSSALYMLVMHKNHIHHIVNMRGAFERQKDGLSELYRQYAARSQKSKGLILASKSLFVAFQRLHHIHPS